MYSHIAFIPFFQDSTHESDVIRDSNSMQYANAYDRVVCF